MSAVSTNKQESGFIIPLLIIIVVIIVIAVIVSANKQKAAYTVSDTNIAVVDSSQVSVSFKVKNTGGVAGKPTCLVKVNSPDHSKYGVDEATMSSSVAPGATATTAMPITVTGNGAASVTAAQVTCH
jgi:hypothetical protein